MSGHSKWATIKRQKGANDAKRGQLFTKLSNAITIAVKQGGGVTDPESNFRLRLTIDKAKAANMPRENIDRAIKRAEGKDSTQVEEAQYEGFGPGGIAVIIETVSDNKQRTFAEVRNIFDKSNGRLGEQGSVSYLFDKVGEIVVKKGDRNFDEVFSIGVDAGCEDVEDDSDGRVFFYVKPSDLFDVKSKIEQAGGEVESSEIIFKPKTLLQIDTQTEEQAFKLLEKLDENEDVQNVFHNIA